MTTGRINQITRSSGTPESRRSRERRRPQHLSPPKGVECDDLGRGARGARPPRHPRRTGGTLDDHPIAPTKPLSAGPHAGVPTGPPWRAVAGCGIRPSGGGSGPRGHAGERRIPRGGSPQESEFQVMASGQRSTDSNGAGDQ